MTARKTPASTRAKTTAAKALDESGAVDPKDLTGPHQTPEPSDTVPATPKNDDRKAMSEPEGNPNTMPQKEAEADAKRQQEAKSDPDSQVIVNPTELEVAPGVNPVSEPEYVEPLKGKSPKSVTKHIQKLTSIDLHDLDGRPEALSVRTDDVSVSVEDVRGRPVVKIWQVGMIGVEPIVVLAENIDEVRRALIELDDLAEARLGEERGKGRK